MEGGRVRPSCGKGRYGVVPPRAPDIVAMSVLQIRLPHHTIGRRHPGLLQPNAASVEEQLTSALVQESHFPRRFGTSWKMTFLSAHQGETYMAIQSNYSSI